jgi:hypothetical protein
MARVKILGIVEHLDSHFRSALEQAVQNAIPDAEFDKHELFREFVRAVGRKCSTWEGVPDQDVEVQKLG